MFRGLALSRLLKAVQVGLWAGIMVCAGRPASGQVRILFVGNSYTHGAYAPVLNYNSAAIIDENYGLASSNPRYQSNPSEPGPWGGVPGLFKKFTDQAGLNYEVHLEAISAATLQQHHAGALAVVQQSQWHKVVLQELSTRPLPVARGGQPTAFFDYAARLEQAVHASSPAAQVYLYQTWARADITYPSNQPYSGLPIDSMTQNLHDAYYRLAGHLPGIAAVAPVGDAWLRAIQAGVASRNPYTPTAGLLDLWAPDRSHASKWGSYLAACVLFGQITGRDPRSLGGTEQAAAALGITTTDASSLQQIAFQQVQATSGPLPVTLTAFAGQRQAAGVLLRWTTATELRNARFEVQRSADGRTFATVATVPGQGNATQAHSYSAFDHFAPVGPLYYRLRQVDFDGRATFSPVVAVAAGPASELVLFPNPAREVLLIAGPAATAYTVRNQLGQRLLQGFLADGTATVELAGLPAGLYHIELKTNTGRLVRRFVRE